MTIKSMTGFARAAGQWQSISWIWEIKSVNGRNLDMRCRLPSGFEALELPLRRKIAEHLTRGSVSASLTLRGQMRDAGVRINRDILDQLISLAGAMGKHEGVEPARLDGLLNVTGVVTIEEGDYSDDDLAAREALMLKSLDQALAALTGARAEEGGRLQAVLARHLDEIARLAEEARDCPAASPEAIRQKFEARIGEFLGNMAGVDPARLAQEAALLATRADVREELDRLFSHIKAAEDLLKSREAVGRRFDFLAQEFNREANTLCSKSNDADLTRIGLDLKARIDQFREQVQNIE
jgi:uncharacterized protein (TIGR00255 family)